MDKSFDYLISPEIVELRRFTPKLKIAILASGEGSNFQELINLSASNKFDIDIKILITNNSDAKCILRAKKYSISYKIIKNFKTGMDIDTLSQKYACTNSTIIRNLKKMLEN